MGAVPDREFGRGRLGVAMYAKKYMLADNAVRLVPRMRSSLSVFGESARVQLTILEV